MTACSTCTAQSDPRLTRRLSEGKSCRDRTQWRKRLAKLGGGSRARCVLKANCPSIAQCVAKGYAGHAARDAKDAMSKNAMTVARDMTSDAKVKESSESRPFVLSADSSTLEEMAAGMASKRWIGL